MNTKQVGDETEARILAALVSEGYSVSIPFGDNDSYDLGLDTGRELLRVQWKTGWIEGDVVRFKTASKPTTGDVTVKGTATPPVRSRSAVETPGNSTGCPETKPGRRARISVSPNPRSISRT